MCNNSTKATSHLICMLNRDLIVLLKTFYHSMHAALDVFSLALVMKPNPVVELHIFRHSYDKQIHVFPAKKMCSLSFSSHKLYCLLTFRLFEAV